MVLLIVLFAHLGFFGIILPIPILFMSNFAVIESGGKQYGITSDAVIDIEVFKGCKEGAAVSFDKVLLFDDGGKTVVGDPYIADKKVTGTVEKVGKRKKISVLRFRAKTRHRRHYGHRQPFCRVRITEVA